MYQKIYVPIDNSEHSDRASDIAIMIGKRFGSTLIGSHVYAARLHDYRFRQMEIGLPVNYQAESRLEEQRRAHGSLIAMGLKLISDSYLDVLERKCQEAGVPFERKVLDGRHYQVLIEDVEGSDCDLVVMGALGVGAVKESLIGSVCERVVRRIEADALIVKSPTSLNGTGGSIVVGIDGSPQSFASLKVALILGKALGRSLEAVSVYDPHLHDALFKGIVRALSEKAAKVFRFKEQEKLHEEIINKGLANIYRSHLESARKLAEENGIDLKVTLLAGKVFEKVLHYVRDAESWLLVLGRDGMHRGEEDGVDLGSNAENLLRLAPCHIYLCGRKLLPATEVKAEGSSEGLQWNRHTL